MVHFPVNHVSFFFGGGTVFQRLATSASAGAGAVCPWRLKANRPEYKNKICCICIGYKVYKHKYK